MEFMGTYSFTRLHTGHAGDCKCKWCFQLKNIPTVVVKDSNSLTTPATPRPKTPILIEPKTFVRVPMIEG